MSQRNAKLLRRFAARERRHNVHVFVRPLARAMACLSHRDRARVRRRVKGTINSPVVRLHDGPRAVFDLAKYAARIVPRRAS